MNDSHQGRDLLRETLLYNFPGVDMRISFSAATRTLYVDYDSTKNLTKKIEAILKKLEIESFQVQQYKKGWL